ncbi:hypothetical protein BGZ73_000148 [Actinomortierella ambigua]|nr:hypothetical protein BGZ73_000148 [Actinomortierella ambigua]
MPGDHACPQCFDVRSIQSCPTCNQLLLSTERADPKLTLQEHLDSQCVRHLLPPVASTAIPCGKVGCNRQSRVVATCPGCDTAYCLDHRHPSDHDCVSLAQKKDQEAQRKAEIRQLMDKHAGKFPQREREGQGAIAAVGSGSGSSPSQQQVVRSGAETNMKDNTKKTKPTAKEIIEAAKAKVALRNTTTTATTTTTSAGPAATLDAKAATDAKVKAAAVATTAGTTEKPKTKRPSRAMALIQLRKVAQGDPKVTGVQRIYLYTRSPIIQGMTGKSVFLDKTWTVGKALDRMIDILKVVSPKPDPSNPDKRLSVFHAKDEDSEPMLLSMSMVIKDIPGIENGDILHVAFSDWDKAFA